jgi:hypothetical protein
VPRNRADSHSHRILPSTPAEHPHSLAYSAAAPPPSSGLASRCGLGAPLMPGRAGSARGGQVSLNAAATGNQKGLAAPTHNNPVQGVVGKLSRHINSGS